MTAPPDAGVPGRRTARLTLALAVSVPLVVMVIAAWQYRWMSDDGFINLRIVKNVFAGHGPVFNPGERVEASTSALWVWMLVAADALLPLRLEWIAVLLGIACTVAGLALLGIGAAWLRPDRADGTIWFPAGLLVLVAIAPSWKFASSGLENGLTVLWIGAVLAVTARWAAGDGPLTAPAAVVVGLGPLVRPELTVLSVALVAVAVVLAPRRSLRHGLTVVAAAFAIPVAYQVFRMGWFGALVPNSALAKEASRPYWSAGWTYLRRIVEPYWLWFPLLVLALGAYGPALLGRARLATRARAVTATFLVVGLLDALYVVRVGGDFMQARLLLPELTMLCAPVAVVPIRRATAILLAIVPWAVVSVATLRAGDDRPEAFGPATRNAVTLADFGWQPGGPNRAWFTGEGVWFLEHPLPGRPLRADPVVSAYGVGVQGYALGPDVYVLDLLGLGDAFTSHLRLDRRATVAHEKPLPFPWIPARTLRPGGPVTEADFPLPDIFLAAAIDDPDGQPFPSRVRDARVALRCGDLRDFMRSIREPMTPGRFLDNLVHAPANTALRIDPEPRDARRQFCR